MTPLDVATAICSKAGYKLVSLEGSGAFKYTFHVHDGERSLALKLFKAGLSERSAREIQAMRKCNHAAVTKFVALSSISIGAVRYAYLLEEHLSGGSLATRLGRIDSSQAAKLALTLSDALDHVATRQLVHRDLKPENVMFRDSTLEFPVIVDFGLVRDLAAASLTATYAMRGPGTPRYAAPEQLNNEKGMIGARTDQFGLGMTIASSVFHAHPYAHEGDTLGDAIERVANWDNPSPTFADFCRISDLEPLIRMVRPYPVERFSNGSELVAAWRAKVTE